MELTTNANVFCCWSQLFMMSKIQNLNGTHNSLKYTSNRRMIVYDVKDTKFEWNSQQLSAFSRAVFNCL